MRPKHRTESTTYIDLVQLEQLAGYQLSTRNIAGWFGVAASTIDDILANSKPHRDAYERGRAKVVVAVVQKQVERALEGDGRALDACAKNLCGWRDKIDVREGEIEDNEDPVSDLIAKLDEVAARRASAG